MEARNALYGLELLDLIEKDLDAFLGLLILGNPLRAGDELIGNVHSGDPVLYALGYTDGL